jgi:hypothetical protein
MNEHTQTIPNDPLINLLFEGSLQKALPGIAEILMNAAMLLERETHIGAVPYQRGVERNGYANGFKPRTFHCRDIAARVAVARHMVPIRGASELGELILRAWVMRCAEK